MQVYTCTYALPGGPLVLTVKQSADPSAAKDYFAGLRPTLGDTSTLAGLGEQSYGTTSGKVVVVKDNATLMDGLNVPVIGSNPDFDPGLLKTPAGPALEKLFYGVASWQQPNGTDKGLQKFIADYQAKYPGSQLDGGLTWGFGAAQAFTEVLKKACDSKDLTRDGMNTAFRSLTNVDTGVVVPLDYSKPGAAPSQKALIFRPDSAQPGGLKQLTDQPYEGPTAGGYVPPALK